MNEWMNESKNFKKSQGRKKGLVSFGISTFAGYLMRKPRRTALVPFNP